MYLASLNLAVAALAISFCSAQTPPGFEPSTSRTLDVNYGGLRIIPAGITVPVAEVATPPALALSFGSSSGSYIAVMMDLSVEPNNIPTETNTTLIHWILPGLFSQGQDVATLNSSTDAIAPYFPPGPPSGQTHTYALFLYEQPEDFSIPTDYVPIFQNLTASVYNRVGFNLTNFVQQASLGQPVAANWFLVSNNTAGLVESSSANSATTATQTSEVGSPSSTSGSVIVKIGHTFMILALGVTAGWYIT